MHTQDGITKGIVIACIAVLSLAIVATVAALSHSVEGIEENSAAAPQHIEPSADNSYLVTPSGNTYVYKFYDDVGAICFLAEGGQRGRQQSVAIYCIPGAK
jgi:hypothetical protein